MADLVECILRSEREKKLKFKTTDVEKAVDLDVDEGSLLASDPNPLDLESYRKDKDGYLCTLARDNTQLLINKIWQLPTEVVDNIIVAKLPKPKTVIPREKPVPKPKPLTKWEKFAKLKSIKNKRKNKKVWDENEQAWKPRWGYHRPKTELDDWVIEIPENADPYKDYFAKRKEEKSERVAKNELQRLRNIARSQKTKVPGVGLTPLENPTRDHVRRAISVARRSTASIGRFTRKLPKEKPAKKMGKKRKFEPNHGDMQKELSSQLAILNKIEKKKPTLDVTKATDQYMEKRKRSRGKKSGSEQGNKGKRRGNRKRPGK